MFPAGRGGTARSRATAGSTPHLNEARAFIRRAQVHGGQTGQAAAARLLTEACLTADRLGMRRLVGEAGELLAEC